MKLTGQKLKEKREAARLTISEVSLATKINPKVLTAMEAGDSEHLPAKTFLRGFVRAYAGFLKMNVAEVLETFNQEIGEAAAAAAAAQVPANEAATTEASAAKREAPSSTKVDVDGEGSGTFRMFVIGGVLVLIVLIIGVRSVVQKYERERNNVDAASDLSASKVTPLEDKKDDEKKDGLTPPPASAPAAAVADDAAGTPAATAAGTQTVPATATEDKAAKVAEEKAAAERKLAEEKKAAEEKKVAEEKKIAEEKKAAEEKAAKAAADKKAADEKKAAEDKKPASKGKRHEIILEALDKVEVSFNLKGETKKIPMSTGQVHTIVTEDPISFDISDGGALNITDNGRDKGPAGDLGHRKQVSIP
jgi:cytoskeletal protein RodZ